MFQGSPETGTPEAHSPSDIVDMTPRPLNNSLPTPTHTPVQSEVCLPLENIVENKSSILSNPISIPSTSSEVISPINNPFEDGLFSSSTSESSNIQVEQGISSMSAFESEQSDGVISITENNTESVKEGVEEDLDLGLVDVNNESTSSEVVTSNIDSSEDQIGECEEGDEEEDDEEDGSDSSDGECEDSSEESNFTVTPSKNNN